MGFDPLANPNPESAPGDTVISIDNTTWLHWKGNTVLADIVPDRRAIALPDFSHRYDIEDKNTWGMPLGDGEYIRQPDSGRDDWRRVEYSLPSNRNIFEEDVGLEKYNLSEVHSEDDEDDDDDEDDEINDEETVGAYSARLAIPRRRRHGASPSTSAGPSQAPQNPTSNTPQQIPTFPYGGPFDPNYVNPQFAAWQQEQGAHMSSLTNNVTNILTHLQQQETENDRRWQQQGQVNEDLATRMQNLSVQQTQYLNPMYTNIVGYAPTGYDYQRPHHPVPQGWTWDQRLRFPGPDYRPPDFQ